MYQKIKVINIMLCVPHSFVVLTLLSLIGTLLFVITEKGFKEIMQH